MANKSYIITLDKGGMLDTFDYAKFHQKLTTAQGVISWWHYLDSTYLLIVPDNVNSETITKFILSIAPNKHFFVAKIDLREHNGWLPKEAWDWINEWNNTLPYYR